MLGKGHGGVKRAISCALPTWQSVLSSAEQEVREQLFMDRKGGKNVQRAGKTLRGLVALIVLAGAMSCLGCSEDIEQTVATDVDNQSFAFTSGAVFNPALTDIVTTLAFSNFATNFSLSSAGGTASGVTTFGNAVYTDSHGQHVCHWRRATDERRDQALSLRFRHSQPNPAHREWYHYSDLVPCCASRDVSVRLILLLARPHSVGVCLSLAWDAPRSSAGGVRSSHGLSALPRLARGP